MQTQKILYAIAAILAIFGVLIGFGAFKTEHTSPNAGAVVMVVLIAIALLSTIAGRLAGKLDSAASAA
ncbi:MAG: hypothetical protein QOE22_728 [Candidatus Parcubacteria bacterium]|jgi:hypothetical protein|nr:hypothetical protein [Candidatus Parcubacteria bacterium]